jgi:hypothetical protein
VPNGQKVTVGDMTNIDALRPTHISQLSAADHHEAQMMVQLAEKEVLSRNEMPSADSQSVLQIFQLRVRTYDSDTNLLLGHSSTSPCCK